MSFHFTRKFYYVLGWDYPEIASKEQKRLRHLLLKQIVNSKIKLKPKVKKKNKVRFKKIIQIKKTAKHLSRCYVKKS